MATEGEALPDKISAAEARNKFAEKVRFMFENESNDETYMRTCTVQTKKITQNVGRSILAPDYFFDSEARS